MTPCEKKQQQENQLLNNPFKKQTGEVDQSLQGTPPPHLQRLNDALMKSEAQNEAMLEGSQDMVFLFDDDLKVISANSSAGKICQHPVGKSCREIFRCKRETCVNCTITNTFEEKIDTNLIKKISTRNQDGRELFFEISCSPVRSQRDDVETVVAIAKDVTDKRQMEKQLRHAFKMEAVGTLAGGIAHDFNNLLTPIMGYSEIIRMHMQGSNPGKEEVVEYVDEIIKAAKRSKKLVEQILTFSRSGEQVKSMQYLHPIVKEVMKLIHTTLPSTIHIRQDIDEECGMVSVDPGQVHQILINLCTNAANAMAGKQGNLMVCLKEADLLDDEREWLELSVADNGCGIGPELRERIFEPYFTTREKEQGTGMGLAMLHGIVKRHGGTIEVESELGEGATFRVFLPVSKETTSMAQVVNPHKLAGGTERILIVDDEEQVVDVARKILENLGYLVTSKTSARETLLLFSQSPEDFDLLITDQSMPYMTGTELCQKVKEVRADIPVILFTGYLENDGQPDTADSRIDGFCMKPVSLKEMAETVRRVIDENSL